MLQLPQLEGTRDFSVTVTPAFNSWMDGWTSRFPTPKPPELKKRGFSESHLKNDTAVCERSRVACILPWASADHYPSPLKLSVPDRCQLLPLPLWVRRVCAQEDCFLKLPVILLSRMSEMWEFLCVVGIKDGLLNSSPHFIPWVPKEQSSFLESLDSSRRLLASGCHPCNIRTSKRSKFLRAKQIPR